MKQNISSDRLAALVRQGKSGDDASLAELCAYVYGQVYAFLYYRVARVEDAEDLTSEIVLRIVRALRGQRGNFHAWMYRIARNRLYDYYRKRAVRKEVSLHDVHEAGSVSASDPSETVMIRERLRKGMENLTEDQRQVIVLKFIQGHDNQEIAAMLGKSVGAIKVLQFRALRALRDHFSRRADEP